MNTPWVIGIVMFALYFAYFETRAFRHPDRQNTLSRAVYDLGRRWPLSIFLMGMLVGGLAVHFFWHWCPDAATVSAVNCNVERPAHIKVNTPTGGYAYTYICD